MLCATCGFINPETASRCANCSASLTRSLAAPFSPVAHSPFNNEPLPQPSGSLPRLQSGGDIFTFKPSTPITPPHNLAELPTNTQVPTFQPPRRPGAQQGTPPSQQRLLRDAFSLGLPTRPNNIPLPSQTGSDVPQIDFQSGHTPTRIAKPGGQFAAPFPISAHPRPPQTPSYPGASLSTHAPASVPGTPAPNNARPAPQLTPRSITSPLRSDAATTLHPFVQPMPRWASLGSIVVGTLLLIGLIFFNPDWATGAMLAGTVALIMTVLLVIAGSVRVSLGLLAATNPYRRAQIISTTLLVLLLLLSGGVGLTWPGDLHSLQARYLEDQHNWSGAVSEYRAAGERAPSSANLARVYNEWGEDLSAQRSYADAVARFSTVLQDYTQVPDQQARARIGLFAAYLAWGDAAAQNQDYAGATSHYDTLLHLNYCNVGCQNLARPRDAAAYAHLAEQQLAQQHFAAAVQAFTVLTTTFVNSPDARQAQVHTDYAKALWGLGQQQLTTTCSNAVKIYQQLTQQFADTSQGQQAATALQQPVAVKGHFTSLLPGLNKPYNLMVALVQGLFVGIQPFQFPPLLHNAPTAHIQSDGSFTLSSIKQGTYELIWSNDGTLHYYYAANGNTVLYTAQVGPLCTYDYGAINATIPQLP